MREFEGEPDEYIVPKKKKTGIFIFLGVLLVCAGAYLYMNREPVIISPVPAAPNFEVVFMTPTPTVLVPTDTPTPTPKGGKSPTAVPTKKISPTSKVTVTPTPGE